MDTMHSDSALISSRQAIPWVLWSVWKNGNNFVLGGEKYDLGMLARKAIEEARIWFDVNSMTNHGIEIKDYVPYRGERKWKKPTVGIVKCNLSASWMNKFGLSGDGWIVRDYLGQVCHHGQDAFTPSSCRIMAELRWIIWSIEALCDLHMLVW